MTNALKPLSDTTIEIPSRKLPRDLDGNGHVAGVDSVSAIVPLFNVGTEVAAIYEELRAGLAESDQAYEMIFVDDASTDHTWRELEKIAQRDSQVKIIRMRATFGETSALDAGLRHAGGNRIVFATARVRVNLRGIPRLLAKMDEGNDLVVGWRTPRRDSGLNRVVSRVFNWLVNRIAQIQLHDINSKVFVTSREVLDNIVLYGNLNIFIPILAARKGFKIAEEQIEQKAGEFRQSRYLSEYFQRLLDILTVFYLTRYSKKPLHFLGFFGLTFTLAGIIMNGYLFLYRFFGFGPIAGRPLLLLGALLLVIGLQMISIGLIGEIIIYTHAREIKEYNIERIVGQ